MGNVSNKAKEIKEDVTKHNQPSRSSNQNSLTKSNKHLSNKRTAETKPLDINSTTIKPQKSKCKLIVHSDYKDVVILNNPRCTLADLIQFIASYPNKNHIRDITGSLNGDSLASYKISHLLTVYVTIYLKQRIKQRYKYDEYIDKYYANIPTMADIQQIYRPYLDHLVLQIEIQHNKSKPSNPGHDMINNLHIYMNEPISMGPIMTLSMNKKDLLVFGYIHRFQNKFAFYTQIIPWDVIKLIHIFFDPINKEYLERFEQIKRQIISIESQINHLKLSNNKNNDEINAKQFELFYLYNKTRDITFIEEYEPHLIHKYLIDTKEYKLKAKEFAFQISMMPKATFNKLFSEHEDAVPWWQTTDPHKPLLLALIKEIVPKEFDKLLDEYKTEIEQQIDIYQDYIKLKLGWISYPNISTYQRKLPDYILEMFKKENAWSTEIEQKIMQLTCTSSEKNNEHKFNFGRRKGLQRGKFGKSFTID